MRTKLGHGLPIVIAFLRHQLASKQEKNADYCRYCCSILDHSEIRNEACFDNKWLGTEFRAATRFSKDTGQGMGRACRADKTRIVTTISFGVLWPNSFGVLCGMPRGVLGAQRALQQLLGPFLILVIRH